MDNNYWKEKYADMHLRLTNKIAELEKENAELKAKIKKYAELNEIDTRDYAALH